MKRKLALLAVSVLPALLLALSALAPSASAAPAAVASPSPRPSLTPPPSQAPPSLSGCLFRVFDNLEHLVIFRCPNGALAFYRMDDGAGRFHSWLAYNGWAQALPGKVALNNTDEAGYLILFGRASTQDVDDMNLHARTPLNKTGAWYHVILKSPGGTTLTDDYFFIDF